MQLALALIAPAFWAGAQAQSLTATLPPAAPSAPQQTAEAAAPAAHSPAHEVAQPWLRGLQLGVAASHGRYREPGLMQTEGPRLGVWAAYPLATRGQWQPTLQGQVHTSAMRYSSTVSGELADVPDHELDLRMTGLRVLNKGIGSPWGPMALGAYAGLGYRWHLNDLRGTTTLGAIGYRRTNQRIYVPLGLQLSGSTPTSTVTASIEYSPALYGTHTTHMSDIGATQDATVSQKSQGWALRVGWQLGPDWSLAAYHRQWITQTTSAWNSTRNGVTQRYIEPASQWRETGIQLGRVF